jgi:hypothetical protein
MAEIVYVKTTHCVAVCFDRVVYAHHTRYLLNDPMMSWLNSRGKKRKNWQRSIDVKDISRDGY